MQSVDGVDAPKKTKVPWKRLFALVFIVLFTAGTVGGSVFYVMGEFIKVRNDEIASLKGRIDNLERRLGVDDAVVAEDDETETDETANWKTYESKEYGFSVKYPSDWKAVDNDKEASGELDLVSPERQAQLSEDLPVRVFDVSVNVYSSVSELQNNASLELDFERWIDYQSDEGFIKGVKEEVLNGASGYSGVLEGHGEFYVFYIEHSNKVYEIQLGDDDVLGKEEENIFNSFELI